MRGQGARAFEALAALLALERLLAAGCRRCTADVDEPMLPKTHSVSEVLLANVALKTATVVRAHVVATHVHLQSVRLLENLSARLAHVTLAGGFLRRVRATRVDAASGFVNGSVNAVADVIVT